MVQEMSFKDISYLELWQPLCSVEWNHLCNFGRRHLKEQFCEIILILVQEDMFSQDISYLELWWPFCYVEQKHLCNFGRGIMRNNSEIILNLDPWFKRCHL